MPGKFRGYNQKKDSTHKPIRDALRKLGATTFDTDQEDVADMIAAYESTVIALEIKGDGGRLSEGQLEWLWNWNGRSLVVHSVDEALDAVGDESRDSPLAPMLPICLRDACKLTALMLTAPKMAIVRGYLLAKAEFERTKTTNQKFKERLGEEDQQAMEALAVAFGYPPAFFYDFLIEMINQGKIMITRAGEREGEKIQNDFFALMQSYMLLLETFEHSREMQSKMIEDYRLSCIPY